MSVGTGHNSFIGMKMMYCSCNVSRETSILRCKMVFSVVRMVPFFSWLRIACQRIAQRFPYLRGFSDVVEVLSEKIREWCGRIFELFLNHFSPPKNIFSQAFVRHTRLFIYVIINLFQDWQYIDVVYEGSGINDSKSCVSEGEGKMKLIMDRADHRVHGVCQKTAMVKS